MGRLVHGCETDCEKICRAIVWQRRRLQLTLMSDQSSNVSCRCVHALLGVHLRRLLVLLYRRYYRKEKVMIVSILALLRATGLMAKLT